MLLTLFVMFMRGSTLVLRFALTLFVSQLMGLGDLGIYGLVVGSVSILPPVLGFGLNSVVSRDIVDLHINEVMSHVVRKVAFTFVTYILIIPVVLVANVFLEFAPWSIALLLLLLVFFEHLTAETHWHLIARRRSTLAAILMFVRAGLWPALFMGVAFEFPALRTVEVLLLFWLGGLFAEYIILMGIIVLSGRSKYIEFLKPTPFRKNWRRASRFYLQDIGYFGYQFTDRFIIAEIIGVEAAGVYTFFWSIANSAAGLVSAGVILPYVPLLVGASNKADAPKFWNTASRMKFESWMWSLIFSGGLALAMPYLLKYSHRPEIISSQWAFWPIMLANVLRINSDAYSIVLYALKRDWAATCVALGGLGAAIVFGFVLTSLFGLAGACYASVLTAIYLLYTRYRLTRNVLVPGIH